MMLGHPRHVEAAALGVGDLRGGQPVALGGVHLVEQAREETQAPGTGALASFIHENTSRSLRNPAPAAWRRQTR
jgi:hypothetical protein